MSKLYKCEGCGGHLLFDAQEQCLRCEYCGAGFPVEKGEEIKIKIPYSGDLVYEEDKDAMHIYECNACHTKIASCVDSELSRCVSCGSKPLKEVQGDGVHPAAIIPFAISKKQAASIFSSWISSRKFSPNNLKKMAKLQKISGFYTPVYSFDLLAHTEYSAIGVNTWEDSEGNEHSSSKRVSDSDQMPYVDYLLSANNTVDSSILDDIGGYNLSGAVGYASGYMLGFSGIGTDFGVHEGYEMLKSSIADDERQRIRYELKRKFDEVRSLKTDTSISNVFNTYFYAPIWANHYTYKNKDYHCYINGQSGAVSGKSPKSFWKIFGLVAGILAGIGIVAALIMSGM